MNILGLRTSEGAIVQHLAKLRQRREQSNKEVPLPLKRGFSGGSGKCSRNAKQSFGKNRSGNQEPLEEEWDKQKASKRQTPGSNRKKLRPRNEVPLDDEYVNESSESDWDMLAPTAKFLELPNDRQQKRRSPVPQTPSKIVSYKCPKVFLEQLERSSPSGGLSEAIQTKTPDQHMSVIKQESKSESEPDMKPGPSGSESIDQSPPNQSIWSTLPEDPFVDSTTLSAGLDIPFGHIDPMGTELNAHTVAGFPPQSISQASVEPETTYIPTGNPATDLPPIGEIFSNSAAFNDSLPPLQSFRVDHSFAPEPGFQDMLGEYFVLPDDQTLYSGLPWQ